MGGLEDGWELSLVEAVCPMRTPINDTWPLGLPFPGIYPSCILETYIEYEMEQHTCGTYLNWFLHRLFTSTLFTNQHLISIDCGALFSFIFSCPIQSKIGVSSTRLQLRFDNVINVIHIFLSTQLCTCICQALYTEAR